MKKSFKLLSLTLSLIMAISAFSALGLNVNAAISPVYDGLEINYFDYTKTTVGETEYGEFEYSVSQYDRACLVKFLGKVTENMIIPAEIDGKKVVEIGPDLFSQKEVVKTVSLTYGLQVIRGTFAGCVNLEEIRIPSTVYSIPSAFVGCESLTEVTVPDSVIYMPEAFNFCTNLETIYLGKKVECLNNPYMKLFEGCTSLKSVEVSDENDFYFSIDGVLFEGKNDGKMLIYYPANKQDLVFSGWFHCTEEDDGSVSCEGVMEEVPATEYTIPDDIKAIYGLAFYADKNLTDIYLPKSVENIETHAIGFDEIYNNEDYYSEYPKNELLTFHCYSATSGEQYAIDNEFDYVLLNDLNYDDNLDVADVAVARAYIVGEKYLSKTLIDSGDMNNDGVLDIIDVAMMRSAIVG